MILLALAATPCIADQCQVVDRSVLVRAMPRLLVGATALSFCEPCGDQEPEALEVAGVSMRLWGPTDPPLFEVLVNGKSVDLAYIFFFVFEDRWLNLGLLAGCEAFDVSRELSYRLPGHRAGGESPPPEVLRQRITAKSFNGQVFATHWTSHSEVSLRVDSKDGAPEIGRRLPARSSVEVHEVWLQITPARFDVIFDHAPLRTGQVAYLLDSLDYGNYRVWHDGLISEIDVSGLDLFQTHVYRCKHPASDCWGRVRARPKEVWWALVQTRDGELGWVRWPYGSFDGLMVRE